MSDAVYKDQLTGYLLGVLPDTETERLDELSIADDEFAAALGVAEKELIDSYVHGELGGDDQKRFESYYLASSLRRDKVDFAKALQIFGERNVVTSTVKAQGPGWVAATRPGWFSGLFSISRPAFQWGLAVAALVLLVAGGLLLFQNVRLRQQINQTQARRDELQQREAELQKRLENQRTANASTEQELARVREERLRLEEQLRSGKSQPSGTAVASIILSPQLRSGQIKAITISPETERIAMQLELEPNDYSTYIVALVDQSSRRILWRSGRVKTARADDRRSLKLGFRAALLPAGMYRMQVSGIAATGATDVIGEYPFRVIR